VFGMGERMGGRARPVAWPAAQPVLSLHDVTASRRSGRKTVTALKNVSLELWPGDFVAIIGARGAGKTMLLRVAAGIERPMTGVACLGAAAARSEWRRRVAFVPKHWRVARGKPALDLVALPLIAEGMSVRRAMRKAREALEWAGAEEHAQRALPELLPAAVTRVALARARMQDPEILMLDEPGATAPPEERAALLTLVRSMAAANPRLAVLTTTRDTRGAAEARRILSLSNGRLLEPEPPAAEVVPFPASRSSAMREPAS
jgi:ABC-type lipoprotein export system ATPase subunit